MAINTGPPRADATLTVDPARLAAVATAFRAAADRIDVMIRRARQNLHVEPAMGDIASTEFAAFATAHQVEADGSFVSVFQRYRDELLGIASVLDDSRASYEGTEASIAASWG